MAGFSGTDADDALTGTGEADSEAAGRWRL